MDIQCRVCAIGPGCGPLLKIHGATESRLANMITECTGYRVDPTDALPQHICMTCLEDLQNAFRLKRTSDESLQYFSQLKEEQAQETSRESIEHDKWTPTPATDSEHPYVQKFQVQERSHIPERPFKTLRRERKHKNSIQDDFFMKFMSENPEMAKGFVKGDRITTDAKWADLTKTLNSAGPPTKDIQGWKKAWSDWKVTIKKKLAHNRRESTTSDGGPFVQLMLSPIETTIAGLCGLSKVVEGFDDSISNFVVEKAAEGHLLDNRENGEESNSKKRPNSEIEEPPSTSSEAQMSWQRKRRVPPLPPGNMEELYSAQNQLMLRVASSLDGIRDHLAEQNRLMAQHFLKMEEIALTKLELQQRTHSL